MGARQIPPDPVVRAFAFAAAHVERRQRQEEGVYEIELTREWFKKAAPFLKVAAGTLSLVLPVASFGV